MKKEPTTDIQNKQVFEYLKKHNSITCYDAFKMGILRLSARIFELRSKYNKPIKTINITRNNKTFAKYVLNTK